MKERKKRKKEKGVGIRKYDLRILEYKDSTLNWPSYFGLLKHPWIQDDLDNINDIYIRIIDVVWTEKVKLLSLNY